jgi:RHH-type proline utilization regulon transcriptional repressor/proline dehydrogenase/delta 1-pyrroline-5-carboxylate dehydrogenase
MGNIFIAGESIEKTLPLLKGLRKQGFSFSADILGEAVVSEKEADVYLQSYLDLLEFLDTAQKAWPPIGGRSGDLDWGYWPKINLSIKSSAMYSQLNMAAFDYSVDRAKERLRPIFRKAMSIGAHITLDMENYDLKNFTLALFKSLREEPEFNDYNHSGVIIQSYLTSSADDLKEILVWSRQKGQRLSVRLVKGAYWDAEIVLAGQRNWPVPVFTRKHETDACFEKLAHLLLENRQWVDMRCATQNIRSLAYVIETAKALKIPRDRVDYQVLYGMAKPVQEALKKALLPVRVYAPVGKIIPGMAYLIRRLLEKTAVDSFLKKEFSEKASGSKESALEKPNERIENTSHAEPVSTYVSDIAPFSNEPNRDWTVGAVRTHFHKALGKVRKQLPYTVPLFVGGRRISPEKEFTSLNPNEPSEIIGTVSGAGKKDAEKAIAAASAAFSSWRDTDPEERVRYLFKAADEARGMRDELASLQVLEVGKSWAEVDADVCEAVDYLEYYGREMIRLAAPRRMGNAPGEDNLLFYEPRGVAVVVAPWNFPLAISVGMTSAAVVTGNTVVYKPSSQSAVAGYMMFRLFERARLPAGVLNFLPGPGGVIGDYLVGHPDVACIVFTGSRDVGVRILERANTTAEGTDHLKHVIAEMGGKTQSS